MSGFDATLNRLCAGSTSLESALSAFHRERADGLTALANFRLIESAWRSGKLDRKSYDVLRSVALERSAGLAVDRQQTAGLTDHPVIASRPVASQSSRHSNHPAREVRAERRTRLHEPQIEPAYPQSASFAEESVHSNRVRQDAGHLTDPSQWAHERAPTLKPGSVLKQRFVLEQVIGRGGMGTIFRARDLRKEEAQDRHPYVAVKVLNEDFRRHPEALISLQREARKAQTLAHPNVATVFDFDRDGPVVFLVMELLEGVSLDAFIKSRVGRPLPQAEASRIVHSLCAALEHAHQKGLVHADFKPANAFRLHDGTVKVLDFGIARAIGRRVHDGEHTVFDPASLGALTPCYASPEMLVGDVPDPRDDVYALACVSYELFCSRHPFDFISSQLAERRKLKPAPIRGLDRRIWRALRHGLEFSRENRTPSTEAFLAEMAPARPFRAAAIAASLVATIGLGVAAWHLVPDYLNDWTQARYTSELQSGDPVVIDRLLPRLLELSASQRQILFDDAAARKALVKHMEAKIRLAGDPANDRVDYGQAMRHVGQFDRLLPDAARTARLRSVVEENRRDAMADARDALEKQLRQGWLIDVQHPDNAVRTIARLRQLDPQWQSDHEALNRIFVAQIRQSLKNGNDSAIAAALIAGAREIGIDGPEFEQFETVVRQQMASVSQPAQRAQTESLAPAADAPATNADTASIGASRALPVASASEAPPGSVPSRPEPAMSLEQRKQRLLALAAADELLEALEVLNLLKSETRGDDPFLIVDAPVAIAETYIRLSDRAFANGQFESAAALLTRAAEFNPRASAILSRRESVDRVAHVAHTLEFVIAFSTDQVLAELEHIEVSEGSSFPLIRAQLAEILALRINEVEISSPQRADELLRAAKRIFPGSTLFASL